MVSVKLDTSTPGERTLRYWPLFKKRNDGGVELWICNDTLNEVTETLTIRSGTFAKGTVWEDSCQIRAGATSSQVVWHCTAVKITAGPDSYLSVHATSSLFPANRYFFSPIKELQRTPAPPEIKSTPYGEHELHVQLRAVTYTYFLHLRVPDERTHFTDNYFDLEAGESRMIIVSNRSITLTPEMVSAGWR